MNVSIIMINYNTYELTKNAIESVIANTFGIEYEIILIDNDSPDKSGEKLKEYFSEEIIYIQASENLGTSKAFNIGVKNAKGEFILWLNTDIIIRDNFVGKLYNYIVSHDDCGICGGNIIDSNYNPAHSFCMELPSLKTVKRSFGIFRIIFNKLFNIKGKREYNFTDTPKEVGYITGADMMVRKSILDDIGGFDEDIFMYAEETEFTYRMKKLTSYKAVCVPDAVMQHLEGSSFGDKSVFNERRFTAKLNGDSEYFKKCYGQDAMLHFLKITKHGYRKLSLFNKVVFRFAKAKGYMNAVNIVNEKIRKVEMA